MWLFSKTGSWFVHADKEICSKRAFANYTQKYPEEARCINPFEIVHFLMKRIR